MALPEESGPAELYYNDKESEKYHRNSRISKIQLEITSRAIELLEIDTENPLILDLGCGSGLSGQAINEKGYSWVGIDISPSMLSITQKTTNSLGLINWDIGDPLPLKSESFDFVISISAVQWLFQSYKKEHHPHDRIKTFFRSIYSVVKKKAVLQFYCGKKEIEILKKEALKAGFSGGLRIDGEGTKNCKIFLILNKSQIHLERNEKGRDRRSIKTRRLVNKK